MAKARLLRKLGVTKSATEVEIKKSYARCDQFTGQKSRNKGSRRKIQEAAEAYEWLSSSDKKLIDRFGHARPVRLCGNMKWMTSSAIRDILEAGKSFRYVFSEVFKKQSTAWFQSSHQLKLTLDEWQAVSEKNKG